MRVSDVFTMGGGYDGHGYGGNDNWHSENPCYQGDFCVRNYDPERAYCDPRSRLHGIAHIIGTRKYGGAGLMAL
jgi:hypothetical protein